MNEQSVQFLMKTLDTLVALPSLIALGERVVDLVTEARDVVHSGQVTDEQWAAQNARIDALRNQLHSPD